MLKSYKTEINLTLEQIQKINKTIGTLPLYITFVWLIIKKFMKEKKFISGMDFSKWLNNIFKRKSQYVWIKESVQNL